MFSDVTQKLENSDQQEKGKQAKKAFKEGHLE